MEARSPWALEQRFVPIRSMVVVCLYWPLAGLFYHWVRDDFAEAMGRRIWIGLAVLCVVVGSISLQLERGSAMEGQMASEMRQFQEQMQRSLRGPASQRTPLPAESGARSRAGDQPRSGGRSADPR